MSQLVVHDLFGELLATGPSSTLALPATALLLLCVAHQLLFRAARFGHDTKVAGLDVATTSADDRQHSRAANTADAQKCWAEGYGSRKHCGLRLDPLGEQKDLPAYSLEDLSIPIPPLSGAEQRALCEFGRRVKDLAELRRKGPGCGGHRTDDSTLLRFLRARKGDVGKAEALLREAAAWRKDMDIDRALTHWDRQAYEQCLAPWYLSGGIVGRGKQGEPVALERLGQACLSGLLRAIPFEVLLRIDIFTSQRCLAALEEDALRRGGPMLPATIVMDLTGFGWDQVDFQVARALSRLVHSRDLLLAECAGRILVVNAPPAFARAWSLFRHLIDPGVREKVEVVSGRQRSLEVLRKFVDDDVLPAFLGGSRTIEGDPNCSVQLAPGGMPPEEAIHHLLELTTRDGELVPAAKEQPTSVESTSVVEVAHPDIAVDFDEVQDEPMHRRAPRSCCTPWFG